MNAFTMIYPDAKTKAITFSYDDGVPSDLRLVELMQKYGIKGTFNINTLYYTDTDTPPNRLSVATLRKIYENPLFEIACHGHTHPYYANLPSSVITADALKNRKWLEQLTGGIIRGFAYPYGPYNGY